MIFEILTITLFIIMLVYIYRLHKVVDNLVDSCAEFETKHDNLVVAQKAVNEKLYKFIKTDKGMRLKEERELQRQITQLAHKAKIRITRDYQTQAENLKDGDKQ